MALNPRAAYTLKLDRAQKHLDELKAAIPFSDGDEPCVAIRETGTEHNVWRFRAHLVQHASPDISLIIGDVVHNLRASLDHMATALRSDKSRGQGQYPILRDNIWNIPDPCTGIQMKRLAERQIQFETDTKGMDAGALTIIKRYQPYTWTAEPEFHPLAILNALDNADKHFELAVTVTGIKNPKTLMDFTGADWPGFLLGGTSPDDVIEGGIVAEYRIHHPALKKLGVTESADRDRIIAVLTDRNAKVDVKVTGTPVIGLKLREMKKGQLVIPDALESCLIRLRDTVFPKLEPFVKA